jgi:uncharacterized protein (TIGR02246 family)
MLTFGRRSNASVPTHNRHIRGNTMPIAATRVAYALLPLAMLCASAVQARSEVCHPISEQQAAALFDRWNDSLRTGDPKKVVANYAATSILLPTVSDTPRLTAQAKEDYFSHFLAKKPVGKIDMRQISIHCNSVVDAGLYTFSFNDGSQVAARYTYTYDWDAKNGKWLITSHHSSAMPGGH